MVSAFDLNVLVLGVGNILLSDEGAGVKAVERLQAAYTLPPQVELLDGGTSGLELLPALDHRTHVFILDVVQKKELQPGQTLVLDLSRFPGYFQNRISPHQLGLSEVLAVAEMSGTLPPQITLLGIRPLRVETGLELSEPVDQGVEELIHILLRELKALGLDCASRQAQEDK